MEEVSDLMIAIERYVATRGLSHSDSINDLINALAEDSMEEC